jgi:poly(3-hydroxybutyrate) depolymerase
MTTSSPRSNARLKSRPGAPRRLGEPGLPPLANDNERGGLLYAPAGFDQRGAALVVSFHGAAGNARDGIDILRTDADPGGLLLLAPASAGPTWDIILRGNGPGCRALDGRAC